MPHKRSQRRFVLPSMWIGVGLPIIALSLCRGYGELSISLNANFKEGKIRVPAIGVKVVKVVSILFVDNILPFPKADFNPVGNLMRVVREFSEGPGLTYKRVVL